MNIEITQLINEAIIDKSKMIKLSLNKSLRAIIEQETAWMDSWFTKLPLKVRCLAISLNYTEQTYPRCPVCQKPVSYKKDYHDRFNKYCSEQCHKAYSQQNKILFTHPNLSDRDWLYENRITLRKSKEQLANELGLSVSPINEALRFHNIPELRFNESDNKVLCFLKNRDWLFEQHKTQHRTLDSISQEIGSSKATLSRWLQIHNIESNSPNSYDQPFVKTSKGCKDVFDFITSLGVEVLLNNRTILNGKEIDIWIPESNMAIEYNGIFWHSFFPNSDKEAIRKDIDYHSFKTQQCEKQGIQLIHLWEDDWILKTAIWKSRLTELLHKTQYKMPARKCQVKELNPYQKGDFLKQYHLQGNDHAKVSLGLFFKETLVSTMTFCIPRYSKKYNWELSRFCNINNHHVQGGFSKLLSHFRKMNNGTIVSYADKSISNGKVYEVNGFKKESETSYNYWYVDPNTMTRFHRSRFMKKRVAPDNCLTENIIMENEGYRKIFGPGTITYVLN